MESPPSPPDLGFWSTASIAVGGMVGGGIFAVFGLTAVITRGGTPIAFLVAGLIALLTSYSYTKLSLKFPGIGGTVTFLNKAFGLGIFTGGLNVLLCLSYIVMIAVYAHAFGNYGVRFFPEAHQVFWKHILMSGVVVLLTSLNAFYPSSVVKSEIWINLLKLSLLILFVLAGIWSIDFHRLAPATWPDPVEMIAGGMVIFLSYEGFELIANASDSVKNPKKNLPRAYYFSIIFVILLYLGISMVVIGNLSLAEIEKNSGSALAESARPFLGNFGFTLIAAAALLASSSAINAALYGSARISFIIAKRGQLPSRLTKMVWHRPIEGLLIMAALALLVTNFLNLNSISTLGSAGFLLIFASVNAANYRLRKETKSRGIISLLAMSSCLIAFGMMIFYAYKKSVEQTLELATMVGLVFVFEWVYRKTPGRIRRTPIEKVAEETESPAPH